MKRVMIIVLAGLLAATTGAFALKSAPDSAIGAEITDNNLTNLGAMVTMHFPGVPLYVALGVDFGGTFKLTSTVDLWLIHDPATDRYISWYLGFGAYMAYNPSPSWFGVGARMPVGIQIWPLKNEQLELFLEVALAWVPLFDGSFSPIRFQVQIALGFRVWSELGK